MSRAHVLVVEGAAAVGKTTVCSELVRLVVAQRPVPSIFNFRQAYTYHPLNPDHPASAPSEGDIQAHLSGLLRQISSLSESPCYILLETLHWTLALRPGIEDREWLRGYERSLRALGAKVLLVTADPDVHRRRLLERRGTEFFGVYGQRYGQSEEEIIDHYLGEQGTILALASESVLPTLSVEKLDESDLLTAYQFWTS